MALSEKDFKKITQLVRIEIKDAIQNNNTKIFEFIREFIKENNLILIELIEEKTYKRVSQKYDQIISESTIAINELQRKAG